MAIIREKRIKSGKLLEVEFFPIYENSGKKIPEDNSKKSITKEAQKKLNKKNAEKKLIRKVNTNFGEDDLFCHLTYTTSNAPGSEEEVKKHLRNYLRRIREYRRKQNLPELKYLYVIEKAEYKRGAKKGQANYHIHMFMNKMDRNTAEKMWIYGTANADRFQPRAFGPKAAAKYIAKSPEGKKRFVGSKNLKKPVELKNKDGKITRRGVEKIATQRIDDKSYWERRYKGYEFLECQPVFNEFNLHWYVSVSMYKKEI